MVSCFSSGGMADISKSDITKRNVKHIEEQRGDMQLCNNRLYNPKLAVSLSLQSYLFLKKFVVRNMLYLSF